MESPNAVSAIRGFSAVKMQVIEGGGSIFKVEAEAKEDASTQPKVSSKWRQKQKKMHLHS